ncbi:hypothetical protein MNEG_16348, partial [Monoraphidium neglectum]
MQDASEVSIIPLPSDVELQGGSALPLGDELTVEFDHDSLAPVAQQLCDWIRRRWGTACAAAHSGTGGGGGGGITGTAAHPPLLHRVLMRLQAGPAGPNEVPNGADAEAYTLVVSPSAPGVAIITAATLQGANHGAGALAFWLVS